MTDSTPDRWSDVPLGTVHDHGCRCWPHVSLSHYEAAALAEYRQGKADIAAERARISETVNRIPPGEFVRAAVLDAIGDDR